jgi:hypothetical protein
MTTSKIAAADNTNIRAITLAFPEHVAPGVFANYPDRDQSAKSLAYSAN